MRNVILMTAMTLTLTCAAQAQVVTPVPPASEPLPTNWAPPPPPAPKPEQAPEPDVAPISIIERDANGKIILAARPIELLALEKISTLSPEQKTQLDEKLAARRGLLDAQLVKNAGDALSMRKAVAKIDELNDITPLISLNNPLKNINITPSLDQFITTSAVLKPKQQAAFANAIKDWKAARTEELNKVVGTDQGKLMIIRSRDAIRERSVEPFMNFNRMLLAAAKDWPAAKARAGITTANGDLEKALAGATSDADKAEAMANLLGSLEAAKQSGLLSFFASPLPTPPVAPGAVAPTNKPGEIILTNDGSKKDDKKDSVK